MSDVGKVYIVGAGCGDFDLITVRGLSYLKCCDVVVYDSLIDVKLLKFAPNAAEKICVGKRAGAHSKSQEYINDLLVQKAFEGKNVVRLKGGDPFVFGRGGEEILALKEHGIKYEVVPGITSSVAVPELAGIPVTHRGVSRSFYVITGHTNEDLLPENMAQYAKIDGTLVFLMGLRNLDKITKSLMKNGKSENTPAAVISNGASKNQQVVRSTLGNITAQVGSAGIKSPAIIVVGETAGYDFSSDLQLPLSGVSVSVTGTKRFVDKLSAELVQHGADVDRLDYLIVSEYSENPKLDNALKNIYKYNYIVLTSINGAQIFLQKLRKLRIDVRRLSRLKFAVIGSGTASVLERNGIFAEFIPEIYTSQALGELLANNVRDGERVLILRAQKGSAVLTDILDKNGVMFDDVKTYDVVCSSGLSTDVIDSDFITFASSSGVDVFFESGYSISDDTKIVCIGDVTAQSLKRYDVHDFSVSKVQNVQGIVDTILSEVEYE